MNWEKRKVLLSLWIILIAIILVYKVFFEIKWNEIKETKPESEVEIKKEAKIVKQKEYEKIQETNQTTWEESIIHEILSQENNSKKIDNNTWTQTKIINQIKTWDNNNFTWNKVEIDKKITIVNPNKNEEITKEYKFSAENTVEFKSINKIFNWDTISLIDKKDNRYSVRLMWIDAPEILKDHDDCYAQESKKYLENITKNYDKIELVIFENDKYWRLIWILLLDWININDLLINNWYVFSWLDYEHIPEEIKNIFIASEQNAKKNKRWLRWNCNVIEDEDWIEREFDSVKRKIISEYLE